MVWLAAGDHEIVVAISPQQIRALAQWQRTTTAADRPRTAPLDRSFGRALDDAAADVAFAPRPAEPALARGSSPIPRMRTVGTSPAISGLLRLRDRAPSAPEPVSDDPLDEDAQWARDILEATGGRR